MVTWIKQTIKVLGVIAGCIAALYLLICCVVVPVAAPVVIRSQGTKALGRPVNVGSVYFNPFLLRADVNGFAIMGDDKKVMAGFGKLWADVSFLKLFKKELRVESAGIDGLAVNIRLLKDGSIDLARIAPQAGEKQDGVQAGSHRAGVNAASAQKAPAGQLPLVIVDSFVMRNGAVSFTDQSVDPEFVTNMAGITLDVSGLSTKPDAQVTAEFKAVINGKCGISDQTTIRPFVTPIQMESTFTLSDFGLQSLTPYVGKYTGRQVSDGTLSVRMVYRISDNKITAAHKVLIQKFEFGGQVESKDALNLPFGLAVALLEDPNGRIDISLPVSGDMSKPDFKYWPLVGQVVRNFFMGLVTKPFTFLAGMMGADAGTQELGYVSFVPGRSDLTEPGIATLNRLVEGLKNRPKLRLEINGSYDPEADWKAISADIFKRDYDALKRLASRRDEKWILQMLYQRRYGIQSLWSMIKDMNKKSGGTASQDAINAEIERRLIDEAPVDAAAFSGLSGRRAQAVYDKIVASGFDRSRVFIGQSREVQASMGTIPLEFTLTVYEDAGKNASDTAQAEKTQ